MYTLACTRFNDYTFNENERWRINNNIKGCIYNAPIRMNPNIPLETDVFVLEMNNTTNKVEGIGYIKNYIHTDKYYNIYDDKNYNRFTYKGRYRLNRNKLDNYEEKIIQILDILLFKGSKHVKRGQGISKLPQWILKNKSFNFVNFCKTLFNKYHNIKI